MENSFITRVFIVSNFTADGKQIMLQRSERSSKGREVRGLEKLLTCETNVPSSIIPGQEIELTLTPVIKTQEGDLKVYHIIEATRVIF